MLRATRRTTDYWSGVLLEVIVRARVAHLCTTPLLQIQVQAFVHLTESEVSMSSVALSQPHQAVHLTGQPFLRRSGAFLIDVAMINLTAVGSMIFVGFHILFAIALMDRDVDVYEGRDLVFTIAAIIISLSYFVLFEGLYGATPGKLLLGMHVMKANGDRCDVKAAVWRALCLLFVDGVLFGLPAYLSMRPLRYQRIGDRVAETIVVRRDEATAALPPTWKFLVAAAVYLMIATLCVLMLFALNMRVI